MADTSLRDKEPDRALVYVFPGSALPALTPPPLSALWGFLGDCHRQPLLLDLLIFSAEASS